MGPQTEVHETVRLQEGATYQFWVTASTKVGEGESTRVVTVSPSSKGEYQCKFFLNKYIARTYSVMILQLPVHSRPYIWYIKFNITKTAKGMIKLI